MKKIFAIIFFISAMCGFAFAQSRLPEFEKAKKIKFLESTRKDVKNILAGYKSVDDDADFFEGKNADIKISYTEGDCLDEDSEEIWNVPEDRVKFIKISPNESFEITFESLGFNISNFQKEQKYSNVDDEFIYHNKNFGIAFEVVDNRIEKIFIFPSNSYKSLLCDNEAGNNIKSSESFFTTPNLEDRVLNNEGGPAGVSELTLSANEIIIGCSNPAEKGSCSVGNREISVTTTALDDENEKLIYEYTVSGGKIIGKGKNVIWDLRGVAPGTYTITAGVNDGCGICGMTKTQTVVVKECSDCSENLQTEPEKP